MAARVAARELREPEPAPRFDFAAAAALDLDGTIRRAVALWVEGAGVDADIFAAWYIPQLIGAGVPEEQAVDALFAVTGWRPRTAEDRERAVARAMLDDGWAPKLVARALDDTREPGPC